MAIARSSSTWRRMFSGATLEDDLEVGAVALPDLLHVLRRETDRGQRVLDLVGDDLGHRGPGLEALGAQDLGDVLDHEQGRRLALAGERNPDQRPVALLALRALRTAEPESRLGELVVPRADELTRCGELGPPREALRDAIARRHFQKLAGDAVGQQHAAGLVEIDHARGDVLDDALDQALLAHQLVPPFGDPARHAVDRLGERRKLEHRRLDTERRRAARDSLRPAHELHDRAGEGAGQTGPESGEQQEDGQRGQQRPATDQRGLGRGLFLLRQERHRQEETGLPRIEAGHRERRVELEVLGAAGARGARGLVLAAERHARPDLARNPPRQESGSEELPLARGVDLASPVETDVVPDDARQPDQDFVVDCRTETESRLEREHVLPEHALRRRQRRLGREALLARDAILQRAREQGVEQHERHQQERREEQDQAVGVGTRHARQQIARRRPRQREQKAGEKQRRGGEERPGGVHTHALQRRHRRQLAREQGDCRAATLAQQHSGAALRRGDPAGGHGPGRSAAATHPCSRCAPVEPADPGDPCGADRRAHLGEPWRRLAPGRSEDLALERVQDRRRVGRREAARTAPRPRGSTAQQRCCEIARRRGSGAESRTRHHPVAHSAHLSAAAHQGRTPLDPLVAPGRRREAAPAGRREIELERVGQGQSVGEAGRPHPGPFDHQRRDGIESRQR